MTLKEFLSLIQDNEVRIELVLDISDQEEYGYEHFWFSDYLCGLDTAKYYDDYIVVNFSLMPEEDIADIAIQIRKG